MKLASVISLSPTLNLVLVGVAVCLLANRTSPRPRQSAASTSETTTASTAPSLPATSNPPASVPYFTNRLGWSEVEAEDFEELARNLRAIGCPEKTIRDVVVARARRGLDPLSRSEAPGLPFWTAGLRRTDAQREAEREVAAARAKLFAHVEQALGRDAFTEDGNLMEDFVEQAVVRFLSGPMSEENFSRLAVLFTRQKAQLEEFRASTHGVWLEEDQAVMKHLRQKHYQELSAVLGPVELEEFTARSAMMNLTDRVRFEATDLSPAEIRTVALIRARFDNPPTGEWSESESLTDEQEAQFTKAIREFLGEARYAQVERAGDDAFKTLFDLGRDHDLPRTAAEQAFEVCQLTAQVVARLREDKSLSDEERQQHLADMQARALESVLKLLGADAGAQYLNHGGAWLTNVSGL